MSAEVLRVDPVEAARVAVLGKTMLELFYEGYSPVFGEDIAQGYQCYIKPGKTHFYNGEEITSQDKSNLAAGNILLELPSRLTLKSRFSRSDKVERQPSLLADKQNPWARPTVEMLKGIGMYNTAHNPSDALRLVAPALRAFKYNAEYSDLSNKKTPDTSPLLPQIPAFRKPYRKMLKTAGDFKASIPSIELEVYDSSAVIDAIKQFDPSTTAPIDVTDSSWAVADMVRDVPTRFERVGFYRNLNTDNAAAYLATLLFDVERLSDELRQ